MESRWNASGPEHGGFIHTCNGHVSSDDKREKKPMQLLMKCKQYRANLILAEPRAAPAHERTHRLANAGTRRELVEQQASLVDINHLKGLRGLPRRSGLKQ